MRSVMRESWRHYRRRYLATGLAILLGVGFCAALLTLATAARQGAGEAASGGSRVHQADVGSVGSDTLTTLTNGVDVLGRFLAGFAVVALVVAGLVISNTFRIVMTQRSRDLALLRCVGAQRLQVFGATVGEGVLLGALASALGTATGITFGLLAVEVVNLSPSPVELTASLPSPEALLVPFLAGVATTGVAVFAPALLAAGQPPLAALARGEVADGLSARGRFLSLAAASLLGIAGCALLGMAAVTGRLSAGLAGGVSSYVAVLIASPVVVPALIGLVGSVLRRLPRRLRGGVPATVAVLDAVRNPRRTAGAVAALTVGVTLISMLCVGAASVSETEAHAVDRISPVDVVLSGAPLPAGLAERLRQVGGVADVVALRGGSVRTSSGRVTVAALEGADADQVVRDASLRGEIAKPASVVVPVARQSEVPPNGSRFTLRGPAGTVRVSPLYSSLQDGPLLVAPAALHRLGVRESPQALYLRLSDAADPVATLAAIARVVSASPADDIVITGGFAQRSTYERVTTVLLTTAVAMLAVSVLIAVVGVGNMLSLSVAERTREYGLLRALGLSTRQLRRLLAAESVLLAAVAVAVGTVLGVCYGWLGTVTLLHGTLNHRPALVVPWGQLAVVSGVAVLAGFLASVLPARHAVRLSPVEGLAHE